MPRSPTPEPLPRPRERRQRVQAAETGMAVLKGLARLGGRASLTALSAQVGEPPAKVHRYLASLSEEGLVSQDAGTHAALFMPMGAAALVIASGVADWVLVSRSGLAAGGRGGDAEPDHGQAADAGERTAAAG